MQDLELSPTKSQKPGVLEELQDANALTLVRAFELFDLFDVNGDGLIDYDEYWTVR